MAISLLKPLADLLGTGRCKKGVFEGDISEGELEIGQVAALINNNETALAGIKISKAIN